MKKFLWITQKKEIGKIIIYKGEKIWTNLFNDTAYKIKTIQKNLGLFAKSTVITLKANYYTDPKNKDKKEEDLINSRKEIEQIKVIDLEGTDKNLYQEIINN